MKKRERLDQVLQRLTEAAPFATSEGARIVLEEIMRAVENEFSGIPEDPHSPTAGNDGRMYPPDDRFEIGSGSPHVRTFKQLRHRTSFGDNGSVRITLADGKIEIDIAGADGRRIDEL